MIGVGSSGSGKSTLIKLIMGQFHDYKGSISYDGTELKEIDEKSLCKVYAVVNQNPFLFDASIEENIEFYRKIDNQTLDAIIETVGLEDFISNRKDNIKCIVGEGGKQVSGGEKQRIAIARALARKNDIIILDEATSSLDNQTALEIEKVLFSSEHTIISVTHKLVKEILINYDTIIAMKNGRIVEMGNFEELIGLKGLFYSLYYLDNM